MDRGLWPVNFISYYAAMRFTNWLHGGDTENGAYTLTSLEPSLINFPRNANARFWIPNHDEWHKAAYFRGSDSDIRPTYGTDYSLYSMGGFYADNQSAPGSAISANYNGTVPLPIGSYPSAANFFGTYDQGGNVEEWFDYPYQYRSWLGGSFASSQSSLRGSTNPNTSTTGGSSHRGLRIAAVSAAQPPVVVPTLLVKDAVELAWLSQVTVDYQVQYSPDLISWYDLGEPIAGTGSQIKSLQSRDQVHRYFRVVVIP